MLVVELSRNDPCPCGSGNKYKKCCLGKTRISAKTMKIPLLLAAGGLVGGVLVGLTEGVGTGLSIVGAALVFAGLAALLSSAPPPGSGKNDPGAINFGR